MKKELRELLRLAEDFGVENADFEYGGEHHKMIGVVNGKPFCMVVSVTKAFSTNRTFQCTKTNIRREVRRLRGET